MYFNREKSQGITLIALVVTIIVLLILAGVSISMLTGENSILQKATDSKEDTIIAKEKEQISLVYTALMSNKLGKKTPINNTNFEQELNNSGNDTTVTYVNNDETKDFLVKFNDTNHEYTVDRDGNIDGKQASKIDLIEFKAGSNLTALGFSFYNTDSLTRNTTLSHLQSYDGIKLSAAWANGYAYIQSLQQYDFSKIDKVEVGIIPSANTTDGLLTFSVGLTISETINNQFYNNLKNSTDIQNKKLGNFYTTSTEPNTIIEYDTSEISGNYYLKILSQHSPSPSAMTMGAKVFWIKIYHN